MLTRAAAVGGSAATELSASAMRLASAVCCSVRAAAAGPAHSRAPNARIRSAGATIWTCTAIAALSVSGSLCTLGAWTVD